MSMDDVLNLKSGDFEGDLMRDCLLLVDFSHNKDFYAKLRARMQETRICAVPVEVVGGWLHNGHHRVAIAAELGFTEMCVTDRSVMDQHWREVI